MLPIRDSLSVQKFHLAFTAGTDDNLLFLLIHPSKNCLKIFFLIHPKDIIQYHRQTFFLTQKLSCSHAHGKINQLQSAAAETFQCFHSVPGSYCHVGCRIHLYVLIFTICNLTQNLRSTYLQLSSHLKMNISRHSLYGFHRHIQSLYLPLFRCKQKRIFFVFPVFFLKVTKFWR